MSYPEQFETAVFLQSAGEDLGADGRDAVVGDVEMTQHLVDADAATERRCAVVRQSVVRQIHCRQNLVQLHAVHTQAVIPVLYYGLEACPVTKARTKSLDYALHSCFRKIFSTRDQVVVHHCMVFFDFSSVSEAVKCKQHRSFNDI